MLRALGQLVVMGGVLLVGAGVMASEAPEVTRIEPLAVKPGATTEVIFHGKHLSGATLVWTGFESDVREMVEEGGKVVRCRLTVPGTVEVGIGVMRLVTEGGVSRPILVMVDDLPSVGEEGGNGTLSTAQEISGAVGVDGVSEPLSYDYFRFRAMAGQRVSLEVVARRLGSRLDSVMRVLGPGGGEVAYSDDGVGGGVDSRLEFVAAGAGDYTVEVRDVSYEGGSDYLYRLRVGRFPLASVPYPMAGRAGRRGEFEILGVEGVAPVGVEVPVGVSGVGVGVRFEGGEGSGFVRVRAALGEEVLEREPNDRREEAQLVGVPVAINGRFEVSGDRDWYAIQGRKGDRFVFRGATRSLGSACDLRMRWMGVDGEGLEAASVGGGNEGTLTNSVSVDGLYWLELGELAGRGGGGLAYRVEVERYGPGFELGTEVERVAVEPGGTFGLKVLVTRREFEGAIDMVLEGDDRLALETEVIEAKKKEMTVKIRAVEGLRAGELVHVRLRGRAVIEGREQDVGVSTLPGLKKEFSREVMLPDGLDGVIAVGIKGR